MPTPIGHALAGLAVAGLSQSPRRASVFQIGILVLCAAAPDLDLALRLVDGVNHHRGASHSLVAAMLAGFVGLLLRRSGADLPRASMIAAAWASHVLLDFLGVDTSPPSGEMALWPFSTGFYISPITVFYDVSRSFTWAAIQHNAIAVGIEIVVLIPIVIVVWRRPQFGKPASK